jgi:putative flavoprotein involved in K+ transport
MPDSKLGEHVDVAVVGGGPGGLATAAVLKRSGMSPVVLERDSIGAFWRGQYDRLHLHTIRWLSNLPGYHFPSTEGKWVSRDGVVRYLERYAAHYSLDVRTGIEVQRIYTTPAGWRLETTKGPIESWAVVLATGYNLEPIRPKWPGIDSFDGDFVLGSDYRRPAPYRGRDVLVVGTGNTGAEIAVDLVEGGAGKVWLSFRTPPNVTVRDGPIPPPLLGMVLRACRVSTKNGDRLMAYLTRKLVAELATYGLPPSPRGVVTQMVRDDVIPVIDVGLIGMLRKGLVKPVPAVERLDGHDVLLVDGTHLQPDAVIACVGYRRGLEPLVGHLGVLGPNGKPIAFGGDEVAVAPRMYFVGYKNTIAGMFREFGYEAKHIARVLRRQQNATQPQTRSASSVLRSPASAPKKPSTDQPVDAASAAIAGGGAG